MVFDNIPLNTNLQGYCLSQAMEYYYYVGKMGKISQRVLVKWSKPPERWFKLNSDGASCGNLGKAGGGGLIRD